MEESKRSPSCVGCFAFQRYRVRGTAAAGEEVDLDFQIRQGGIEISEAEGDRQAAKAAAKAAFKPVLEARAIDLLKASSARLAAAKSMSFTAVVSYESQSRFGPPLGVHDQVGRDAAAPRQTAGDHLRRRSAVGVLLQRQDDDGIRAGRESRGGCRSTSHDRRRAQGSRSIPLPSTFRLPTSSWPTLTRTSRTG